jgi:hypothetical protein
LSAWIRHVTGLRVCSRCRRCESEQQDKDHTSPARQGGLPKEPQVFNTRVE